MKWIIRLLTVCSIIGPLRLAAQWEQVGESGNAYAIALQGSLVFFGLQNDSVYVSADQGDTWSTANTGITNATCWWLESIDGTLYNGTQGGPSFRSTDNGATWVDIGMNGARGFTKHNDTLYVCRWYSGSVHWSVDEGDTWNATEALSGSGGLWPMLSYHGYLFLGGQGGGVYRIQHSTDAWQQMNNGLTGLNIYTFATIGDRLYLGGTNGVWYSDDDGTTWTATGFTGQVTYALHTVGSQLYAGGDFGIRFSSDSGATWTLINDGLSAALTARLVDDGTYLYAGVYNGGGVNRRLLSEITSDVHEIVGERPRPSLFPVPARDRVQLTWPGHVPVQYRVRDLSGSLAATGAVGDGSIGVAGLPAGAYFLEVSDRGGERVVLRLVRE